MKQKDSHILYYISPYILGMLLLVIFAILKLFFKIDFLNLKGLKDVLNSVISFVSIVIGFYSAFYGMIISVHKSNFFVSLQKSKYKDVLPNQLYCSLIFAFLALILTIALQVLMNYAFWLSYVIYFAWAFVTGVFMTYAFLTSILSIAIIFYSDPLSKKIEDLK